MIVAEAYILLACIGGGYMLGCKVVDYKRRIFG